MGTLSSAPPTALQLGPELVEIIRGVAFDGLKALPRRGAEIGGFLTALPSVPSVAVDLRLVGCEHLYGPSYRLSERDVPQLAEAKAQSEKDGQVAVAYFRSSTRATVNVEAEDRAAIAAVMPNVPFVVLARPAYNGSALISIHGRD